MNTLWGKVFQNKPAESVISFTAGRDMHVKKAADNYLLPYDIWGSQAHCVMLYQEKIIDKNSASTILKGLEQIECLVKKGEFALDPSCEDVHTNIESYLIERYGIDRIGKLHTGRSRNDQSNVDTRLFIRDKSLEYIKEIIILCYTLVGLSQKYISYVIPGFTHHQHAMMSTFGHILMSFATMLARDTLRFSHWYYLHNTNPLGSAAGYGTSFPINSMLTSELLGFDCSDLSSLDQITNRWEPEADFVFSISVLMNHLSLMAQTFIILATPQFGMLTLSDDYSTGSSIMPQKKNPDPLEVMKGKTAFIAGLLQSLMSLGKANFIGYNRDSQWSKYALIDAIEESQLAPEILCGVIKTMKIHKSNMEKWCYKGFIGAPTLMEQIVVNYNVPFRKSKMTVEKAVKFSHGKNSVTYEGLKKAMNEEDIDIPITYDRVKKYQDPFEIIKLTQSTGGPGGKAIQKSVEELEKKIKKQEKWLKKKHQQKISALKLLKEKILKIK